MPEAARCSARPSDLLRAHLVAISSFLLSRVSMWTNLERSVAHAAMTSPGIPDVLLKHNRRQPLALSHPLPLTPLAPRRVIYVEVPADAKAEKFGIKIRDEAAGVSYNVLVKAGLVADDDDDDFDINECEGMEEVSARRNSSAAFPRVAPRVKSARIKRSDQSFPPAPPSVLASRDTCRQATPPVPSPISSRRCRRWSGKRALSIGIGRRSAPGDGCLRRATSGRVLSWKISGRGSPFGLARGLTACAAACAAAFLTHRSLEPCRFRATPGCGGQARVGTSGSSQQSLLREAFLFVSREPANGGNTHAKMRTLFRSLLQRQGGSPLWRAARRGNAVHAERTIVAGVPCVPPATSPAFQVRHSSLPRPPRLLTFPCLQRAPICRTMPAPLRASPWMPPSAASA